ncbi:alpha/beta hydrolase [Mucilaginibacter sp. UR6-1]|uniref:alpha/beta fold hydrolase n=1 Tax=Mucilaginibacter sp. UR6-1 TaxID=1435643 RepID=UPI001E4E71D6|nr:alpha/beta hydrolase [Mucilaginibacter sp. UR6-1]MCC8408551.1 alpha/beta hydrolase [Mucilaginibacter sp. UR6-1]
MKTRSALIAAIGLAVVCMSFKLKYDLIKSLDKSIDDGKPTIVLVHGAFADGSSWNKVIPILQKKGYQTIAVQNPLTSLTDDVAFTQRAIAEAPGKVVLVGHSYGGAVITQAGNNDKVTALVYVAAYAPDEGQSVQSIEKEAHEIRKIPNVPGLAEPIVSDGYIRMKEDAVIKYFAQDLPLYEAKLIAAGQGRFHFSAFTAAITNPAWKNKPSFYVVAENDKTIAPDIERETAKKIRATTISVPASHVVMLSQPQKVAQLILQAAGEK